MNSYGESVVISIAAYLYNFKGKGSDLDIVDLYKSNRVIKLGKRLGSNRVSGLIVGLSISRSSHRKFKIKASNTLIKNEKTVKIKCKLTNKKL
jgi:hypothetical protein